MANKYHFMRRTVIDGIITASKTRLVTIIVRGPSLRRYSRIRDVDHKGCLATSRQSYIATYKSGLTFQSTLECFFFKNIYSSVKSNIFYVK